jgi:hypothetical protein
MKTPDQERLLRDVLNEDETYKTFRAELRETMLVAVRQRHRSRYARPLLALAACVVVALSFVRLVQTRDGQPHPPAAVAIVRSVPLRPSQIVTTGQSHALEMVQSRQIELISANFEVVRTLGELSADRLTDEQLLQLFHGRAVALISLTAGKKLVFLDEGPQPESAIP